jgi:hypothetical protein
VSEEPGDPADEWRLVDATPGWMLAAGKVVELVAEVSVARTGEEVEDDADESDGENDGRSGDDGDCERAWGARRQRWGSTTWRLLRTVQQNVQEEMGVGGNFTNALFDGDSDGVGERLAQ